MDALDPRHGTNAGATAHWQDGEKPCRPCALAKSRATKAASYDRQTGRGRTVKLGDTAHHALTAYQIADIKRATGLSDIALRRLLDDGPEANVRRTTRDKILAVIPKLQGWTSLGISRRIQALHVLGWSAANIADHAGVAPSSVTRLRDGSNMRYEIRSDFARKIIATYEAMSHRLPPSDTMRHRQNATKARQRAKAGRWAPPLAWDDIDHDAAPVGMRDATGDRYDDALVDRILGGEWELAYWAPKSVRFEVIGRWLDAGRSQNELGRLAGWKVDRDVRAMREAEFAAHRPAEEAS